MQAGAKRSRAARRMIIPGDGGGGGEEGGLGVLFLDARYMRQRQHIDVGSRKSVWNPSCLPAVTGLIYRPWTKVAFSEPTCRYNLLCISTDTLQPCSTIRSRGVKWKVPYVHAYIVLFITTHPSYVDTAAGNYVFRY